jgi:hypothetical protein
MQPTQRTFANRRNNGEAAQTWRQWADRGEDGTIGLCFGAGAVCAVGAVAAMQVTQAACESLGR